MHKHYTVDHLSLMGGLRHAAAAHTTEAGYCKRLKYFQG